MNVGPEGKKELTLLRQARAQVRTTVGRFNIAEFLAQTEAAASIQTLAGFRDDWSLSPEFRRVCANDLLDRGYGKPKQSTTVQLSAGPDKEPGDNYAAQIEGAMMMADAFKELNAWVSRGIPYEQWPEHIKEMAGEAGASACVSEADGLRTSEAFKDE